MRLNRLETICRCQCWKNALELVLAIYQSQKEGKAVQLPLTKFASVDMMGEFKLGNFLFMKVVILIKMLKLEMEQKFGIFRIFKKGL